MNFQMASADEYARMNPTQQRQYMDAFLAHSEKQRQESNAKIQQSNAMFESRYKSYAAASQNIPHAQNSYQNIPSTNRSMNQTKKQHSHNMMDLFNQLKKGLGEKIAQLQQKDDLIQAQLKEKDDRLWEYLNEKENQFQAVLKEKDEQFQAVLKEKDEQICRLHDIISNMQNEKPTPLAPACEEDDIQVDQNILFSPQMPPKTKENTESSVVVTNIPETMIADDAKTILTDIQIMEPLIQNIDQNAKIVSVKRMGKKDSSKNRPIQVSFKTKNEKNTVLKNAPEYIKSQQKLKEWKVFVNNYESPDAHKIQVKLTKKKDQLYKARGGNTSFKYFIKEKQIFVHDTSTNETKPVECDENIEAAQFYKRNQKCSLKETKNNLSS